MFKTTLCIVYMSVYAVYHLSNLHFIHRLKWDVKRNWFNFIQVLWCTGKVVEENERDQDREREVEYEIQKEKNVSAEMKKKSFCRLWSVTDINASLQSSASKFLYTYKYIHSARIAFYLADNTHSHLHTHARTHVQSIYSKLFSIYKIIICTYLNSIFADIPVPFSILFIDFFVVSSYSLLCLNLKTLLLLLLLYTNIFYFASHWYTVNCVCFCLVLHSSGIV